MAGQHFSGHSLTASCSLVLAIEEALSQGTLHVSVCWEVMTMWPGLDPQHWLLPRWQEQNVLQIAIGKCY
jgi:hypothetical protein